MLRNDNRKHERGFTLIELLVVMVILGMLASLVLPNFFGQAEKAREKTALVQIRTLGTALDAFALDVGHYPSQSEGLEVLVSSQGVDRWDGPYLKGNLPKDPWGEPYAYQAPSSGRGHDYKIVCKSCKDNGGQSKRIDEGPSTSKG